MAQNTQKREIQKKDVAKAYEKYSKQFTPKPTYFANCLRAFIVGGLVCTAGFYVSKLLMDKGMPEEDAGTYVTIGIVALAQLLTGRCRGNRADQRLCQLHGGAGYRIQKGRTCAGSWREAFQCGRAGACVRHRIGDSSRDHLLDDRIVLIATMRRQKWQKRKLESRR